jgi:hypothetical protein
VDSNDGDGRPLPGSVEELGLGEPIAIEMSAGDAMLMDVRTFHYGSANTSTDSSSGGGGGGGGGGGTVMEDAGCRAQLSATFEEPPPPPPHYATAESAEGGSGPALQQSQSQPQTSGDTVGFTYELREDLRGKYALADFLPQPPSPTATPPP